MEGKTQKRLESPYPADALVCFFLGALTVGLVVKPLGEVDMASWWWGFFIVCNICYIGYGMKKGQIKGDAANGLIIATGPIAFYSWTYLGAWRKYKERLKRGKRKQT